MKEIIKISQATKLPSQMLDEAFDTVTKKIKQKLSYKLITEEDMKRSIIILGSAERDCRECGKLKTIYYGVGDNHYLIICADCYMKKYGVNPTEVLKKKWKN